MIVQMNDPCFIYNSFIVLFSYLRPNLLPQNYSVHTTEYNFI